MRCVRRLMSGLAGSPPLRAGAHARGVADYDRPASRRLCGGAQRAPNWAQHGAHGRCGDRLTVSAVGAALEEGEAELAPLGAVHGRVGAPEQGVCRVAVIGADGVPMLGRTCSCRLFTPIGADTAS